MDKEIKNDCSNLYKGKCMLTAHHMGRELWAFVCAYPHNCREGKDYKPKEKN